MGQRTRNTALALVLPARRRLRRAVPLPAANAAAVVAHAHPDMSVLGEDPDVDASPGAVGERVERVVDQVADDRHEILARDQVGREVAVAVEREMDAALATRRGLGEQQRGERGVADAVLDEVDLVLGHADPPRRERDRVLVPAQLDEPDHRVQLVGGLVRLGAERVGEAANGAPYEPLVTIDDIYPERPDR